MAITQIFIYLQLLDLLTTLVGFKLGAREASPFIRMLMHAGPAAGSWFPKSCPWDWGDFASTSKRTISFAGFRTGMAA